MRSLAVSTTFLSTLSPTSCTAREVAHRHYWANRQHRDLLNDILDPSRRYLSWFAVHLPGLTKWLYTRTGSLERFMQPVLPMQKPTTYTGIREYALQTSRLFEVEASKKSPSADQGMDIISRLWKSHSSVKKSASAALDSLDIASVCADHLLAGIDTTADTLMFLIWALPRPQNADFQRRLIEELRALQKTSSKTAHQNLKLQTRCHISTP